MYSWKDMLKNGAELALVGQIKPTEYLSKQQMEPRCGECEKWENVNCLPLFV